MSDVVRLYEGLFLLNQQSVAADFAATVQYVRDAITATGAELLVVRKWDERKLAYPIQGQKRGVFLLIYFRGPVEKIVNIERDFKLSEHVLRSMIIRADHIGETELELAGRDAELSPEVKLRGAGADRNVDEINAESKHQNNGDNKPKAGDVDQKTGEEGEQPATRPTAGADV
jgi:small subunit ribosomal protein S6